MATRRDFLEAATVATLAGAFPAAAAAGPVHHKVELFVGDSRFEESVGFLKEAARSGGAVRLTDGDVTRLWYDELYHRWRSGPAAIAGLTGIGALFCLERWAWDVGMRVVLRIDHEFPGHDGMTHEVAAERGVEIRNRLDAPREPFAVELLRAVTTAPVGRFQVVSPSGPSSAPAAREPLVTWLIAPIERSLV